MNPSPIAQEYDERGRSELCPIIDMHGHAGPYNSAYFPSASPERMIHSMERAGVKRLVLSHHVAIGYDAEWGNTLTQELIDRYPDCFLGYWTVNPNFPAEVTRGLQALEHARGFVGLKFWADYHRVPITSPKYQAALEYAEAHGLLILIHTQGRSSMDGPALVGEVASRYPRSRLVMAHSGYGEWETSVAVARDHPNVFLDLTGVPIGIDYPLTPDVSPFPGSPQVNGIIEFMVETAGSEKIVFGSDLPWFSQHYHAGAVLYAHITDDDRHNILHRNAERLLGPHLTRGQP